MSTKTPATMEDLSRIESKAELVDGEIVCLSPTGGWPGHVSLMIVTSLVLYARRTGQGRAIGDNVGFRINLTHRESFSPDAAYYVGPDPRMKFCDGAPLFAAEVRSENDYGLAAEAGLTQKRANYFACGTLVVWDVDVLSEEVVKVYGASDPAHPTYRRGAMAEAAPTVPGWCLPVAELFG